MSDIFYNKAGSGRELTTIIPVRSRIAICTVCVGVSVPVPVHHLLLFGRLLRSQSGRGRLRRPLLLRGRGPRSLGDGGAVLPLGLSEALLEGALPPVLEGGHLPEQVLDGLWVEGLPHGCVLGRALLDLHVDRVAGAGQHRGDQGAALLVQVGELGVRGDEEGPGLGVAVVPVLVQHSELLLPGHPRALGDEEAELPQDVRRDPDGGLVASAGRHVDQEGGGGVALQVPLGVVGDDLHDPVPDGIGDVISGDADELEDGVDVPPEVGGVLLGQDGDLEDHLLPNASVGLGEVGDELVDDALCVVGVAHDEEQVEGPAAHGDVRVLEADEDGGLVLLDPVGRPLDLGQARHGHEAQVADVGLPDRDELAQELHGPVSELRGAACPPAHDEVDRLEEDGVVGVGLVDGVGHVGVGEDPGDGRRELGHVGLGLAGRDRAAAVGHGTGPVPSDGVGVELEELEQLDLKPGARGAVVQVLPGAGLLKYEQTQDVDYVGDETLVLERLLRSQSVEERGGGGEDSQVAVLQEQGDLGRELPPRDDAGAGPDETEEAERRLLLDGRGGGLGEEGVLYLDVEGLDELQAGHVGDAAEGEGLGHVGVSGLDQALAPRQVCLDGRHDSRHGRVPPPEEEA